MLKALIVAMLVFVFAGAGVYLVLGMSFAEDAALALRLRSGGEVVHARVTARRAGTHTTGTGSHRHSETYHMLDLESALADGTPWSTALDVGQAIYEAHPEGSTYDLTVLSAEPGLMMATESLEQRDASGHFPNEASDRILMSLISGGGFSIVAALIVWSRGRRAMRLG